MRKYLIILSLVLLVSACSKNDASTDGKTPAQHAEGVVMQETVSGAPSWKLKATSANFYDNKDVTMENPVITFNKDQKNEAILASKHGSFKGEIITFWGSVMLRVKDENLLLTTEKLFYNTETKIAWTNVPFTLKRNGITIKGKALKASDGFSNIEIFKQVTDLPADLQGLK